MEDKNFEVKDSKIIYDPRVAREFLKMGYTIIDIKPDKFDKSRKRTVFVFKNENGLEEKISVVAEKFRTNREADE